MKAWQSERKNIKLTTASRQFSDLVLWFYQSVLGPPQTGYTSMSGVRIWARAEPEPPDNQGCPRCRNVELIMARFFLTLTTMCWRRHAPMCDESMINSLRGLHGFRRLGNWTDDTIRRRLNVSFTYCSNDIPDRWHELLASGFQQFLVSGTRETVTSAVSIRAVANPTGREYKEP